MRYQGPHVCPNCGERVSAFAAGCALCGADLDPRRGQGPPPLRRRLPLRGGLSSIFERARRPRARLPRR